MGGSRRLQVRKFMPRRGGKHIILVDWKLFRIDRTTENQSDYLPIHQDLSESALSRMINFLAAT